ncbi:MULTISPECIES: hypothetical protein [Streptomyces]|uniref:hypothetical protein n=1 Tax=Streptomyces TaxID=1883 RepID=UPI00117D4295|nr:MULTISPECIES: hypothetical protein [Streptomyces]MDX3586124.1 hypothetical protein [Streptomyces europaeiscabiei]MDX3633758.1 hypothetical protein [Streptomyces europaeiscabiei]MDX3650943.1 hypothetical protein [Streptomyces europaeiscabiei]
MARSVWRRRRKPTLTDGREADRTGPTRKPTDDPATGDAAGNRHPGEENPHATPGAHGDAAVGCFVAAAFFLIACVWFIATRVTNGELPLWGLVVRLLVGVVIAVVFTTIAWWAANTWRQRRDNALSAESPRAGREKDDQNPVGSP